jgi:hypothetical protein
LGEGFQFVLPYVTESTITARVIIGAYSHIMSEILRFIAVFFEVNVPRNEDVQHQLKALYFSKEYTHIFRRGGVGKGGRSPS